MKRATASIKLVATVFLTWVAASQPAIGSTILDGFESASLSPIWTASGPGAETLANAVAHSGNQSVFFQVSSTFPWNAQLTHDFGSEQAGTVSVFMERPTGPSSSAAALEIDDPSSNLADIQQAPDGSFIARILPGPNESDFFYTSASPNDWNLLQITTSAAGITLSIDGTAVASDPSIKSFQLVSLQNWGGPSGSAYFDDFSATTTPEPGTALLLGLIGLAMALAALRERAKRYIGWAKR